MCMRASVCVCAAIFATTISAVERHQLCSNLWHQFLKSAFLHPHTQKNCRCKNGKAHLSLQSRFYCCKSTSHFCDCKNKIIAAKCTFVTKYLRLQLQMSILQRKGLQFFFLRCLGTVHTPAPPPPFRRKKKKNKTKQTGLVQHCLHVALRGITMSAVPLSLQWLPLYLNQRH